MKVTINHKDGVWEYPCLKILDGNKLVLFTAHNEGILLVSNGNRLPMGWSTGYYIESLFKPFHGSVTLEN